MTFLPIVERELRVAARKRSTFWIRVMGALVALVIGIGFLILASLNPFGSGAASFGKGLFATLTWLSLAAGLCAGLFLTSDCLSEEKREGTLGFLFLTDLHGYDVALGKLLSTSLRAFYALLAIFPILAITLTLGGVTGAQFWKTILALINALVVSLAGGLFVSAISQDSQRAMMGTLLLLLLINVVGPIGDAIYVKVTTALSFNPFLSLSSPCYLFITASAWGKSAFWLALLTNQAVAWLLLGLTAVILPRTWQMKSSKESTSAGRWARWWMFGGAKRQVALRTKLLGTNPALWLACRTRWQAALVWFGAVLVGGSFVGMLVAAPQQEVWAVWSALGGAFALLLYLGFASHASRFLVDARKSGLIELLLASPLTVRQITHGQWMGLLRMFGLPVFIWLVANTAGTYLAQQQTWGSLTTGTQTTVTTGATTNTIAMTNGNVSVSSNGSSTTPLTSLEVSSLVSRYVIPSATAIAETLSTVANLIALVWFGMWMGLTSKNNGAATLKTLLFVQVIPWFAFAFASALAVPLLLLPGLMFNTQSGSPNFMVWHPLIITGVSTILHLAKDLFFSLWARKQLYTKFRERAAGLKPTPLKRIVQVAAPPKVS